MHPKGSSLQEIDIAVKQLQKQKCPGPDGLPVEWYQIFYPRIKYVLHSVFLKNIQNGMMHGSSRESVISLMDKPDKNLLDIDHWRPLNLLNVNYKIYAKILANRLQCVMNDIISKDQTGFLKGRRMTDNILDLNLIIDYCQKQEIPAIITVIDFKKAFDTIQWDAMEMIMNAFGLGENFIRMIMVCFNNFRTRI